ncbi:AlpA family phage regulatory protein [Rubrivivax sp. A210]|uniref:helix-turn-helix transcriptional regulator n=1 Tax=Rubrivivax sp. A210 TaxID=2772301 RepID=UPI00191A9443|nr:AlpA family phage regulatory protein [Rubrivivax sp. A210]CAD5366532.1 AlpA family phage regulatory protein [Rubrivivax sp. A210]
MSARIPPPQCIQLPATGYLRLKQFTLDREHPQLPKLVPVSPATLWRMVKNGDFPQPIKLLPHNITVWRVEDVLQWIAKAQG